MQDSKMKFTLSIALIYSIWYKSVQTQGVRSFEGGGDGPSPASCCLSVSNTKIPIVNLLDYYVQDTSLCPIRAIRFRTRKNKTICSDPEDKWAKKAMIELNAKRAIEPSKEPVECQTSQSKPIPTPLTTFISKANDNSVAVTAVMITTSPTKRIKQLPKRRRGKSGKGKSLRRYQYRLRKYKKNVD
nr:C-C motif chemokine 2-like [Misgurnus anguillicaudatus]XP_055059136.1 C-C motif chemokine 2-like [Misgurnus anguillicaudatus]